MTVMFCFVKFCTVLGLCYISFANSHFVYNGNSEGRWIKRSLSYNYDRIAEINKQCAFVLKSAGELKPDDSRLYTIKEGLSFMNGDWWQELNNAGSLLMPFDDRELSTSSNGLQSPLKLVSFWVTDVDHRHHSKNSIFVSGVLQLGMTFENLLSEKPYEGNPRFDIWPGHSQLSINFQGIYTESKNGERVMCLIGSAVLPSRQLDKDDPWGWVKEFGYTNQPLLTQDDRILLELRYPETLTLKSRAIRGSMKSLNPKSNLKYFDEVLISSQLRASGNYQFVSEDLVSKACDPYPYKDSMVSDGIDTYKGLDFCIILKKLTHQEMLKFLSNWKCNGTDAFCSKLGPFSVNKEINATDGSFKNVKLVMQDVWCENTTSKDNTGFMRVSSVFRAVPPSENQFTAAQRTGISNMTLLAEGIWKSSSGQLCMIGCPGFGNVCDTRICLYIPLSFSIKQRSILLGSFSSTDLGSGLYFPLEFEKLVRMPELWDEYSFSRPYYKYSKINAAMALLEKYEPFNFGTVIKKSLLKFPKIDDEETFPDSVSLLAEDLTLHIPVVPDPFPNYYLRQCDFGLEILSIGPLFGRFWPAQYKKDDLYPNPGGYTQKQLLLNVSGQINLLGKDYANFTSLFVEGVYDPLVGKMYLIGCRDVRASWKILYESMDLEGGLDCLVEVVISYPPTAARWLFSPTAKISISSKRTEDDPLFFSPIKLQTIPIMYRKQREDILSRRGVEGILRILTLSFAVGCILSQLFYTRQSTDSLPYMSIVMLGVEVLGYGLPLITGAEALLKRAVTDFQGIQAYDLQSNQWIQAINYTVKLLLLVAFFVTLHLLQKVWKSRSKLLTRTSIEPYSVPSDKKVLFTTLVIHLFGYIVVLVIHYANTMYKPLQTEHFIDSSGNYQSIRQWQTNLEEYFGLVQDFFLLPQMIGNLMWRIELKPLRKLYYIGITSVRVLPHVYDCIRSPVSNPYFSEEYEFVNPRMDFFSKFGDIAIPLTEIVLAIMVYVQQRLGHGKLSRMLLPKSSKAYEKVPSEPSVETEMACRVDDRNTSVEKEGQ